MKAGGATRKFSTFAGREGSSPRTWRDLAEMSTHLHDDGRRLGSLYHLQLAPLELRPR